MTGHVLTLVSDGGTPKIRLEEPTGGGGGDVYTGASPSNITVGGLSAGTTLTGRTYTSILQEILVTTFFPTLTPPSLSSFTVSVSGLREVGSTIGTLTFNGNFSRGSISPQYPPTSSPFRSGPPNQWNFTGTGLPATTATTDTSVVLQTTNHVVILGSNSWSANVDYDAGVQPYDSDGNPFNSPLGAGTSNTVNDSFTGIYPWFYGTSASANPRPTAGSALLTTGTKSVTSSTGTVNANFNTSGAEWTWVAIPASSPVKTVWYVTALNNGTIGGVYPSGNKYPAPTTVSVNSPTALWSGINYNFYISELPSIETNIEFRNS
jgi:hypothetical protein